MSIEQGGIVIIEDTVYVARMKELFEDLNASAKEILATKQGVGQMGDQLHAALLTTLDRLKYVEIVWFVGHTDSLLPFLEVKLSEIRPRIRFKGRKHTDQMENGLNTN